MVTFATTHEQHCSKQATDNLNRMRVRVNIASQRLPNGSGRSGAPIPGPIRLETCMWAVEVVETKTSRARLALVSWYVNIYSYVDIFFAPRLNGLRSAP